MTPEPRLEKLLGLERSPSITDLNELRGAKGENARCGRKENLTQLHVGFKLVPGDHGERSEIKRLETKKVPASLFPTVSPCAPPYLYVGDRPLELKTMNATVKVKNKNCSSLT